MSDRHERGDKPSRKDVRRMMDTVRGVRPNTPDQIIIGGVTITRQQWETMDLLWKRVNKFGTWEAFVAANTPKPEHWDGEPCELPVFAPDRERAKGYRHEYTGKQVAMGNTPCWYAYPPGDCIIWGTPSDPRWELRAVRIEPEHKVGDRFVYTEDHPRVLSSYGLPNPCEFEFVRLSDTKHAGEAIYFSETCPVDFSSFRIEYKCSEPRWILRPIINPEHVKGEPCTAPVWDIFESEAKEIDHFLFNELSDKLTYGEWYLTRDGTIGLAESNHTALRWTLTAVPRKPAPRYDVGKWVVPPNGEPFKVVRYDRRYYWANKEDGWIESSLRPAVREDFMVTFGGVKVWMIRKNGVVEEFRERSDGFISWEQLLPWQVTRNRAAGIMDMPEVFCHDMA